MSLSGGPGRLTRVIDNSRVQRFVPRGAVLVPSAQLSYQPILPFTHEVTAGPRRLGRAFGAIRCLPPPRSFLVTVTDDELGAWF